MELWQPFHTAVHKELMENRPFGHLLRLVTSVTAVDLSDAVRDESATARQVPCGYFCAAPESDTHCRPCACVRWLSWNRKRLRRSMPEPPHYLGAHKVMGVQIGGGKGGRGGYCTLKLAPAKNPLKERAVDPARLRTPYTSVFFLGGGIWGT